MDEPHYFVAYASSAVRVFTAEELTALLAVSRARNGAAGVTGMLVHKGGNFLQALEGPEHAVRATMARIARDPRHRSVIMLHEGFHEERLFGEWSMAFEEVPWLDPSTYPGMSRFLTDGVITNAPDAGDDELFEFFRAFRENMR